MTLFDVVVLGIVEGITEFLPISSTGHLILAKELLGVSASSFSTSFTIAIQLGAILSVVWLYIGSFFNIEVVKRVLVAFAPTAIIGFLVYPFAKSVLLESPTVVLWALGFGGAALIIFELIHKEPPDASDSLISITYMQAFLIGIFQAIAIVPGVSRSAATILGGLIAGVRRVPIVEFSFLLAVPTMLAATGFDLLQSADAFSLDDLSMLAIGFVTSFAVALATVKFLLSFIRTHSFISFGAYRILAAVAFFIIVL